MESIETLELETVRFEPREDDGLRMTGVMAMREPGREVRPWLRAVHRRVAASGRGVVVVDVRGLSFMNSSSIRLFIDWIEWIRVENAGYALEFHIDPAVTWQNSTFGALRMMSPDHVRVIETAEN